MKAGDLALVIRVKPGNYVQGGPQPGDIVNIVRAATREDCFCIVPPIWVIRAMGGTELFGASEKTLRPLPPLDETQTDETELERVIWSK
jgi:hypothetical protein